MDYKLICIDMDGTLLNSKHKISQASKEALKRAHDKGVHIVISTGRTYTDAKYFSNLIGVKSPVIASNGSIIKEKDRDEVIYKSVLGESLILSLLAVFSKNSIKPLFSTPEKAYSQSIVTKIVIEFLKLKGIINKNMKLQYVFSFKQWEKILKEEKDNIIKCEVQHKDVDKLRRIREQLELIPEIEVASSGKNNVEVTCKGVSKGSAVEILANYYNIEREKIIAIGDSGNDLTMIEFAGLGVAMGNAIDIVKQKADYVTDTNDNDGVAKVINKFI